MSDGAEAVDSRSVGGRMNRSSRDREREDHWCPRVFEPQHEIMS